MSDSPPWFARPGRSRTPPWVALSRAGAAVRGSDNIARDPAWPERGANVAEAVAEEPPAPFIEDDLAPPLEVAHPSADPPLAPKRRDTFLDELAPAPDDEALNLLRQSLESVANVRSRILRETEAQVVELALVVAQRVIAREVELDPGIIRGVVREALEALAAGDRLRVRIGHRFADVRKELEAELRQSCPAAEVVVDSSVGGFGCVVSSELGEVDESIETRLATLLEDLSRKP